MSWIFFYSLFEWTIRVAMVPMILRRRFAPATSLAWLSIIFFLPLAGVVLYALIGMPRLGRRRVRQHQEVVHMIRSGQRLAFLSDKVVRPEVDPALRPVILQAEHLGGMPILGGNDVELLARTDQTIDRLVTDIERAQHHVHLLYYIFAPDETGHRVAQALIAAASRGVTCRLLADAVGSRALFGLMHRPLVARLRQHGVHVARMLPASPLRRGLARLDLRNHRKLAVIDGLVAYAGSQNIVNPAHGHRRAGSWLDMTGRFTGPVVGQLQAVFLEDWVFETDQRIQGPNGFPSLDPTGVIAAQAVPTGPDERSEAMSRITLAAINAAQREIIITTPYLVPDEPTMVALSMAAGRGVTVSLVVPHRSDHPLVSAAGRAYYGPLLDAGVHLFEVHGGLLHAKTATVDNAFALLGSSNLDIRSFYLNYEISVLLYGPQVTQRVRDVQTRYLADARPVDREQWQRRPHVRQFIEAAASLLSPLL